MIGRALGWGMLAGCMAIFAWIAWTVAVDKPMRSRPLLGWAALGLLWSVTGVVLIFRFTKGLGSVTAMTDAFPWGVWIGLLQSGVALSGGGFVMAATVHVFHLRRFEPILRPAVLSAFLGYNFVAMTLLIEVGRPYRIWHPIAMWQHHSIMFEVAWCVTLYMTVLALEFSPVLFDKFKLAGAQRIFELVTIPLVIAGVLLSTLHQSSMGSMFLLMPQKIHPLWYTPLLPVFFLISSVAVGLCVLIVEFFYASKLFGRTAELALLPDLARTASWVLILYWAVKAVDLTARHAWGVSASLTLPGASFWLECFLGGIIPAAMLSSRRIRHNAKLLVIACLLAVAGVVLNRLNTSWIGMLDYSGPVYIPSWMELAVTLTLATGVIVLFGVAAKFLPVFSEEVR
jgi:Ni/Fe-hydrogenase subunit HybB-like protein